MTDDQILMRTAALGMDAEAFMGSSLGKALIERARAEADAAMEELKAVSPDTREGRTKIRELQNHIWKAESFILWLAEIYQEGRNAEKELQSPTDD